MTDNEIIKALEELLEMMLHEGELQKSSTISNTIDLINRKDAEIEKKESTITQLTAFLIDYKNAYEKVKSKNADLISENTQLRGEIEGYKHLDTILHTAVDKLTKEIQSEAIKEFAEELKIRIKNAVFCCYDVRFKKHLQELLRIIVAKIDNLVKEMEGDTE